MVSQITVLRHQKLNKTKNFYHFLLFNKIVRVWEPQTIRRKQLVRQQVRKHTTHCRRQTNSREESTETTHCDIVGRQKGGPKSPVNALADAHVPEARIFHAVNGIHTLKRSVDISAKLFRLH